MQGTHDAHDDVSGQGAQLPDSCADAVRHAAVLGGEQLRGLNRQPTVVTSPLLTQPCNIQHCYMNAAQPHM